MKKNWTLTKDGLELLLEWLSVDREKAGIEYERIRKRLIKLYIIRGCVDPEALSDETINRVISKLPEIVPHYEGDPIRYFYGVANKVYQESLSSRRKKEDQLDPTEHRKYFGATGSQPDGESPLTSSLKDCLDALPRESRDIIVEYFAADTRKSEYRRALAEKVGVNLNTLRIKVLRLKKKLEECVSAKHQEMA